MGSSLQRLEVLLIGLVVLIAGAVVAVLMFLRPPSPTAYVQATPQPIVVRAVREPPVQAVHPTSAPNIAPTTALASIPTAESIQLPTAASATAAPAATSDPSATAVPQPSADATRGIVMPNLVVPPIVRAIWPWLLLAVGLGGVALVGLRIRRRRMTYTNQNMGQFLTAADATTRATTIKVMRDLAAKGELTAELAAAAGIDLAQPHKQQVLRLPRPQLPRVRLALPRFTFPRPTLPALYPMRVPKLNFSHRQQRLITIDLASAAPAPLPPATNGNRICHTESSEPLAVEAARTAAPAVVVPAAPAPTGSLGVAPLDERPDRALREAALRGVLAAQAVELPEVELETRPTTDDASFPWTAEDRALAVANVIAEVWAQGGVYRDTPIQSPIVALDTANGPGSGQVIVSIDQHPDEEELIVDLPDRIVAHRPTWRAAWRQDVLDVFVVTAGAQPPVGGPLIIPILAHGRGGKTTRFYPLAAWRHLGLYGGNALGALHAVLSSLLYAQPPANMGVAILDKGEITPLYRNVAHLVSLPSSPHETIELLAQTIRRGTRGAMRPLVLVVVEPDDTALNMLLGIAARLQARPTTPLHLIMVQERLSIAGRELYAMLPALILSGGRGSPALLPSQGEWPKRGEARLVGRGMRAEGHEITLDEAEIARMVAELRGTPSGLLPVLWDAPAVASALPAADLSELDEQPATVEDGPIDEAAPIEGAAAAAGDRESEHHEGDDQKTSGEPEERTAQDTGNTSSAAVDAAAQRRRIVQAIAAQRQRLMDALAAPPAAAQPGVAEQIPSVSEHASAAPLVDDQTAAEKLQATVLDAPDAVQAAPAAPITDAPVVPTATAAIPLSPPLVVPAGEAPAADPVPAVADAGADADAAAPAPVTRTAAGPTPDPDGQDEGDSGIPPATPTSAPETLDDSGRSAAPTSANDEAPATHSRRAALFLAALDAGNSNSPPLHRVLPRRSEPPAAEPPAPAAQASADASSATPAGLPPMVEPDNGWPIGPTPLGRVAMAELMARVVATPAIVAGQANELGVTKNRLVDVLKGAHKTQAKELGEILLVWFDLAGLLIEPTKPGRLRHPRALVTTHLAEIAAKLHATSCPDKGTVKAMWSESNVGRN